MTPEIDPQTTSTELVSGETSFPDLSNLSTDQLKTEISTRAETYAASDGKALAGMIPYIREFQKVLSQRPKSDRNREPDGVTFTSWLTETVKELKKKMSVACPVLPPGKP